jgi:hypothetical protein
MSAALPPSEYQFLEPTRSPVKQTWAPPLPMSAFVVDGQVFAHFSSFSELEILPSKPDRMMR